LSPHVKFSLGSVDVILTFVENDSPIDQDAFLHQIICVERMPWQVGYYLSKSYARSGRI